jgi:hypothetical protein
MCVMNQALTVAGSVPRNLEATEVIPARGKKEVKKCEKDPGRAGRLVLYGHVPPCAKLRCLRTCSNKSKIKTFRASRLRESNSRSHGFGILGLVY